jgi:hypothetical protein
VGTYGFSFFKIPKVVADPVRNPTSGPFLKALTGFDPADGPMGNSKPDSCLFVGQAVLGTFTPKVEELNRKAERRYLADKRVRELVRPWKPCMNKFGFKFSNQNDIEQYFDTKLKGLSPTDPRILGLQTEERSIYRADKLCQASFMEKLAKLRKEYESEVAVQYLRTQG